MVGGYVLGLLNKLDNVKLDDEDLGIIKEEIQEYDNAKKIKNIALFEIDTIDGETERSDSIMIATIDPIHNKLN